jgi:hypothetical protein
MLPKRAGKSFEVAKPLLDPRQIKNRYIRH